MEAITYGGAITNLFVPDKNGKMQDIVIGFDNVAGKFMAHSSFTSHLVFKFENHIFHNLGEFQILNWHSLNFVKL